MGVEDQENVVPPAQSVPEPHIVTMLRKGTRPLTGGGGGPNLNVGLHLLTYSFALLPFHRCNALDQLVLMLNKRATVHTN